MILFGLEMESYTLANRGGCQQILQFTPFVPKGQEWPRGGENGYFGTIRICVVGMVQQHPPGRWQWVFPMNFDLLLPRPYKPILGDRLYVDGWFYFSGEKASRKVKTDMIFHPKNEDKLLREVPKGTRLKVEWQGLLLPAPTKGVTIWGAFAVLENLEGLGDDKDFEDGVERGIEFLNKGKKLKRVVVPTFLFVFLFGL